MALSPENFKLLKKAKECKSPEKLGELAKQEGLDIPAEKMKDLFIQVQNCNPHQLNDEDFAAATGGGVVAINITGSVGGKVDADSTDNTDIKSITSTANVSISIV
ncbi:MAG: hypothetical protein LBJ95_03460 [Oscillospiraceae bacterium]|jgi:hypothetical protein|nr:hypothetical protein [Oscillospiraceae bacterium]